MRAILFRMSIVGMPWCPASESGGISQQSLAVLRITPRRYATMALHSFADISTSSAGMVSSSDAGFVTALPVGETTPKLDFGASARGCRWSSGHAVSNGEQTWIVAPPAQFTQSDGSTLPGLEDFWNPEYLVVALDDHHQYGSSGANAFRLASPEAGAAVRSALTGRKSSLAQDSLAGAVPLWIGMQPLTATSEIVEVLSNRARAKASLAQSAVQRFLS